METDEDLLLLPTNAPCICYCIGSSWPDLTCKQWSPVNHQRPFTSPAAAGRVPVSTPITLTPPKPATPIVGCHGLCFRDHLQRFGSKELLFFQFIDTGGYISPNLAAAASACLEDYIASELCQCKP